jgi:hypothetical protein
VRAGYNGVNPNKKITNKYEEISIINGINLLFYFVNPENPNKNNNRRKRVQ